jgi:hypothetical protein
VGRTGVKASARGKDSKPSRTSAQDWEQWWKPEGILRVSSQAARPGRLSQPPELFWVDPLADIIVASAVGSSGVTVNILLLSDGVPSSGTLRYMISCMISYVLDIKLIAYDVDDVWYHKTIISYAYDIIPDYAWYQELVIS